MGLDFIAKHARQVKKGWRNGVDRLKEPTLLSLDFPNQPTLRAILDCRNTPVTCAVGERVTVYLVEDQVRVYRRQEPLGLLPQPSSVFVECIAGRDSVAEAEVVRVSEITGMVEIELRQPQ